MTFISLKFFILKLQLTYNNILVLGVQYKESHLNLRAFIAIRFLLFGGKQTLQIWNQSPIPFLAIIRTQQNTEKQILNRIRKISVGKRKPQATSGHLYGK